MKKEQTYMTDGFPVTPTSFSRIIVKGYTYSRKTVKRALRSYARAPNA
jgi:hypothetical protein